LFSRPSDVYITKPYKIANGTVLFPLSSKIPASIKISRIGFLDFEILRKQISKFFYILQASKMNCKQPQDNLLELKQM